MYCSHFSSQNINCLFPASWICRFYGFISCLCLAYFYLSELTEHFWCLLPWRKCNERHFWLWKNYRMHFSQFCIKCTAYRWKQVFLFVSQFVHSGHQYREALLQPQYSSANSLCWLTSCFGVGLVISLKLTLTLILKATQVGWGFNFWGESCCLILLALTCGSLKIWYH